MVITILNFIGLIVNFSGALMMFLANPKVDVNIGQFPNGEDLLEYSKREQKTALFRWGMFILSIGFLIQLFALLIPLIVPSIH